MPLRPCIGLPGERCDELTTDTRCEPCALVFERRRTRAKRERRPYLNVEKTRRAATVEAWVAEYGWWCPGYGVPGHESHDLTADHVEAVAAGGDEDGPLGVLCRSCNGRKGSR